MAIVSGAYIRNPFWQEKVIPAIIPRRQVQQWAGAASKPRAGESDLAIQ